MIDEQYYEVAKSGSIASQLLLRARDQIFMDFMRQAMPHPADSILDVGVSDVLEVGANVLERKYPHPAKITACGLGEGAEFQREFPQVRYVRILPNDALPFPDGHFAIATCNAVLEHVGSLEAQLALVSEMCRVSRRVFITVPNKYFPVEHHTAIPLLHYFPWSFGIACRAVGKAKWTEESNLILMSRQRLERVIGGRPHTTGYTGLRLGPLSSNLYASIAGSRQ